MNQLKGILLGLNLRQRITIGLVALLAAGGIYFGVRWNHEQDMRPLFTNLNAEDAGAMVERLKSANVDYRIGENGAVLVPSAKVAEIRLEMASAGIPRSGRIGFELFDKVNLGTTDFAEQVNFRRALEGELERSIMALSEVERARVHVTFAKESVFNESRQPAKASVMIKLRVGSSLSPVNVVAVQHLTASAVEGLAPESVSVLDMNGNLLSKPRHDSDPAAAASSAGVEYRQTLEREMLTKVKSTLDPLLGEDRYRAGLNLEIDFSSGEQSEETFDPSKSVMVSSSKSEDASGLASTGGVPGTATNLPRPSVRTAGVGGGVSRKTESIAYQTSRTVKHVKMPQGSVKRVSLAILLDQSVRWEGSGKSAKRVVEAPSPERLKVIRDVLAGVVGFQQERGDQILVETLPFEATLASPAPEVSSPPIGGGAPDFKLPAWTQPLLKKAPMPVWLGALASLVIVFLVGLYWLLRRFRPGTRTAGVDLAHPQLPAAHSSGGPPSGHALEEFEEKALAVLAENKAEQERMEKATLASLQLPPQTKKSEVLRKVIADQAKEKPEATAQLIRSWLNEGAR